MTDVHLLCVDADGYLFRGLQQNFEGASDVHVENRRPDDVVADADGLSLICIDAGLGQDAWQRSLRAHGTALSHGAPIVLIGGHPDSTTLVCALDEGACDWWPCIPPRAECLARVRAYRRLAHEARKPLLPDGAAPDWLSKEGARPAASTGDEVSRAATDAADAERPAAGPGVWEAQPDLLDLHLLVVEGSDTTRRLLRRVLACWGVKALVVDSPAAARSSLETLGRVDVVLIDTHHDMAEVRGLLDSTATGACPGDVPTVALVRPEHAGTLRDDQPDVFDVLDRPLRPEPLLASLRAARRWQRVPSLAVLVVDDSTVVRRVAVAVMRSLGHDVRAAEGGAEALSMLDERAVDLVLTDLQMPDLDGFETAARIRARPGALPPRIVAMSGTVSPEEVERCRAEGILACLEKPLRAVQVNGVLRRLLHDGDRSPDAMGDGSGSPLTTPASHV